MDRGWKRLRAGSQLPTGSQQAPPPPLPGGGGVGGLKKDPGSHLSDKVLMNDPGRAERPKRLLGYTKWSVGHVPGILHEAIDVCHRGSLMLNGVLVFFVEFCSKKIIQETGVRAEGKTDTTSQVCVIVNH